MIRVGLVEDKSFLLRAISEKLSFFEDLKLKHTATNGLEIIELLKDDHNVDVILMDIQMPVMDGIEATKVIKEKYPQIMVIMLTVFDDEQYILKSIQAGANGYLLKDEAAESLHDGIIEILNGGAPMTPSIAFKALKLLREPIAFPKANIEKPDFELTPRESDVLLQLSKGFNYNEIANNLFISPATVRKHIENIYRKLQVRNKIEALNLAREERLI